MAELLSRWRLFKSNRTTMLAIAGATVLYGGW